MLPLFASSPPPFPAIFWILVRHIITVGQAVAKASVLSVLFCSNIAQILMKVMDTIQPNFCLGNISFEVFKRQILST